MGEVLLRGTAWFLTLDAERCNALPWPTSRSITQPSDGVKGRSFLPLPRTVGSWLEIDLVDNDGLTSNSTAKAVQR